MLILFLCQFLISGLTHQESKPSFNRRLLGAGKVTEAELRTQIFSLKSHDNEGVSLPDRISRLITLQMSGCLVISRIFQPF